jgi:chemotaxis response regulator CheB
VKRVSPTQQIRVLPMNIPKLLFDLIKGIIVSSEDLHIVGEPMKGAGILRAAAATKADVIILSDKDMSADNCYCVLYRQPRLKIFAISTNGRRGSLYELRPRAKTLRDLSAESLIAAIRGRTSFGGGSAVPRK